MTSTVPLVSVIGSYKVSRSSMFCLRTLAVLLGRDPAGRDLPVPDDGPSGSLRTAMRTVCTTYSDQLDEALKQRSTDRGDTYWPGMDSHAADRQALVVEAFEWTKSMTTVFPPYPADTTVRDALCAVIAVLLAREGREQAGDILGVAMIDAAASMRVESTRLDTPSDSEMLDSREQQRQDPKATAQSANSENEAQSGDDKDEGFLAYLRRLRREAGSPSLISLAAILDIDEIQPYFNGGKQLPEWTDVNDIVRYLGGDIAYARSLWTRYCASVTASRHYAAGDN